ncbi:hypothetical protein [Ornithinibacillus sp. FSL M8-0202]|uniref:hypothetical protein n=1 Tax=unclassified Ornithinibacillus TaxID=2620869 RepID=UPI0030D0E5DE
MNTSVIERWKKRYEQVNVFEEFDTIIDLLKQEYCREEQIKPWVVSYSGGKDSSLVLTLVWQAITQLPASKRKRKIHVIMSDTAVETPVMELHQHSQLKLIEQSSKAQGLDHIIKVHMVRPPITSRFFYKIIGRGTPNPTPN